MQCQIFLNGENNIKNKAKYILLIVLTKMDKIGAVTTFDFGVWENHDVLVRFLKIIWWR